MTGIEEYDTKSGIHVIGLDYVADPVKRSPEWEAMARRGLPTRDWEREYKRNWTIASGLGVYTDSFNRELHVAHEPLSIYDDRPILRGWDFGLSPACVWVQGDPMGRINVLAEEVTWNGRGDQKQMGVEQFCPIVQVTSKARFPGAEFKDWADPAGWQRAQTDETTCVQIMQRFDFHPTPGPVAWTARRDSMNHVLAQYREGRFILMVDPRCRMIIEGLAGKYQFDEIGQTGEYRETVAKNAWSHIMNGLEYIVGACFPVRRDRKPEKLVMWSPKWIEKKYFSGVG